MAWFSMATEIRPIRTKRDYEAALKEVESLWGAKAGTPEGDRLDVLATLIDAYETEHYPMDPPGRQRVMRRWRFITPAILFIAGPALADDPLAAATRVVDCEWAAANKFDDGRYSVAELAQRVIGTCTLERYAARRAVGFSPLDQTLDADEFRQAVDNVEGARKARPKRR